MSTVITFFLLPIGIVIFFWDRRNERENLMIFERYTRKLVDTECTVNEMMELIERMFNKNGYEVVERTKTSIVVEKKHVNPGIIFMLFGIASYIGLLIYLFYYYFLLRPQQLYIDLNSDQVFQHQ